MQHPLLDQLSRFGGAQTMMLPRLRRLSEEIGGGVPFHETTNPFTVGSTGARCSAIRPHLAARTFAILRA